MTENLEQKASVFTGKSRTIIIILIVILASGLLIGYFSLKNALQGPNGETRITEAPAIRSVPGVGEPSRRYVQLQQQQNIELAEEATKQQTAAIPTITRPTYLGDVMSLTEQAKDGQKGCSIEELRKARAAGVSASELRCRGCSVSALKAAGYTAGELREAGFTAQQLKDAGFTADQLKAAGFSANDLKAAGFSDTALQAAGYSQAELVPSTQKCDAETLRNARLKGISASVLKSCGAAALRAAGYTASELKNAGFSAGELKAAGFSAKELKDAGFTPQQLREAGFSAQELKDAGFTAQQLKDAGFTDGDLVRAGYEPSELGTDKKVVLLLGKEPTSPVQQGTPTGTGSTALPSAASLPIAPGARAQESKMEEELARIREQQAKQMSRQEMQDRVREMQQNMLNQTTDLFSSWVPLPKQQFVEAPLEVGAEAQGGAGATGTSAGQQAAVIGNVYKAGTVLFAVLDTGINSDEPSPIMATVVNGKLKGSKILGQFNRIDKKVVLQFSTISVPKLDKSLAFSAYAVDPNSARTALASSTDSHYLLRYGSLFASAFLEGLGQALSQSGSTTVNYDTGAITQVFKELNTTEQVGVALGTVGQKFGEQLKPVFEMPPTVKVSAGLTIGILLMNDLTVPYQ